MRRVILTLTFVLICTFAFADGVQPNGSGTETDPYLMESLDNLLWLSTNIDVWSDSLYFLQTADIDASDTQNWNGGNGLWPIGTSANKFSGTYDGGNHTISDMHIDRRHSDNMGMWGYALNSSFKNLSILDTYVSGDQYVAIFVAKCSGVTFENCHCSGQLDGSFDIGGLVGGGYVYTATNCSSTCTIDGNSRVGGLIGYLSFSLGIENCSSDCSIAGNSSLGGLIGYVDCSHPISFCSSNTQILMDWRNGSNVGGLIGFSDDVNIDHCNADCTISCLGYSTSNVGGLIGYFNHDNHSENYTISNCFVTGSIEGEEDVGGLVGGLRTAYSPFTNNLFEHSYYDYETFTINGEHEVSFGAVPTNLFNDWVENGFELNPDDYLLNLDGSDDYLISSPEDLRCLMAFGQDNCAFRLTANIDMAEYPGFYLPVFCATLNGDNHTISNLSLIDTDNDFKGFIGFAKRAVVSDLNINNIQISGNEYIGGMAGYGQYTAITNCNVNGLINVTHRYVGGFCGFSVENTFTQCSFNGSTASEVNDSNNGGICGYARVSDFINCFSNGEIINTGTSSKTGGIVGRCYSSTFQGCYSEATIDASRSRAGGIVGYSDVSTVNNCYFSGIVMGSTDTGGIVGISIHGSEVNYCYVNGEVYPPEAAAIVGYNTRGEVGGEVSYVRNCVWDSETMAVSGAIGHSYGGQTYMVEGHTRAEMREQSTYTNLGWDFVDETENGTEDYWDMSTDWNEGYPYIHDIWVYVDNDEEPTVPPVFETTLSNAYPNPFNPSTTIAYSLSEAGPVEISVYNIRGQRVKKLVSERQPAGQHNVVWNGTDSRGKPVSSGIYFYRMTTPDRNIAKKMVMVK